MNNDYLLNYQQDYSALIKAKLNSKHIPIRIKS